MFEQAFKNIDDILRNEAGCTTELDYTEQTSWLLFLKYLDGLEQDRADEAGLAGKTYTYILDGQYRWESWAAPKNNIGGIDYNTALTGDDLRDLVNLKLFPYLSGFKLKASGPNTIEYKIGEIFSEINNKIQSGYNLREIIDHIDELRFRSQAEKHELSFLYEAKIKNMGNAGRNGGEYYTPRPLIRAIVQVVRPQLGERIYDGALGSAGFLCEAYEYLKRTNPKRTTAQDRVLQERTFYGKEKKSLAYVIGIMNMILHGIDAPNILHTNTLTENLADIQEKDRYDVVLANPPFGGGERKEVQQNFPIRTGETAFLFLQHFIKIVRAGGRGGVVIKNTFLSNTDNASVSLRKLLLESCNLHTVLDCPSGTFQGAGVKTVVLFFDKGAPTRNIWFYQLDPGRNLGKTNPLNDADLTEFVTRQKTFTNSPKSWSVDASSINQATFDLSVKNPNVSEDIAHLSPLTSWTRSPHWTPRAPPCWRKSGCCYDAGVAQRRTWRRCDVLDHRRKPITQRDRIEGVYPYFGATGVLDHVAGYLFDEPLVLVGEDGAKWNSGDHTAFAVDGKCWVNNHAHVLRPHRHRVLDNWLIYYLNHSDLTEFVSGLTVPKLNQGNLRKIPIPLPPLHEQQRIVGIIDAAFEGIATAKANAERNLHNARAIFDSYLQSVFSRRGEGWATKKVGEIAKHSLGKMLDKAKNRGALQPYLRNLNVRWFAFDLSDILQMPFLPGEMDKYTAVKGDVLICEGGYPGRAALWNEDYPIHFQKALHRVRFDEPEYNKWFVYYLYAEDRNGGLRRHFSGTGIQHFTGEALAKFEIPFPPVSDVRHVVATFDELVQDSQCLESVYGRKLVALEALKKSVLHQAFTGEL